MGIVISKINSGDQANKDKADNTKPPVDGAVRLSALEMNNLHFGSDKTTPLASSGNKA